MNIQEFGKLCYGMNMEFYANEEGLGTVAQLDTDNLMIDIHKDEEELFHLYVSNHDNDNTIIDKSYTLLSSMMNSLKYIIREYDK